MPVFDIPTGEGNFVNFIYAVNVNLADSMLGLVWLLMIFTISFLSLRYYTQHEIGETLAAASWLTMVSGILMLRLYLVSYDIVIGLIMLTAISTVLLFRKQE